MIKVSFVGLANQKARKTKQVRSLDRFDLAAFVQQYVRAHPTNSTRGLNTIQSRGGSRLPRPFQTRLFQGITLTMIQPSFHESFFVRYLNSEVDLFVETRFFRKLCVAPRSRALSHGVYDSSRIRRPVTPLGDGTRVSRASSQRRSAHNYSAHGVSFGGGASWRESASWCTPLVGSSWTGQAICWPAGFLGCSARCAAGWLIAHRSVGS